MSAADQERAVPEPTAYHVWRAGRVWSRAAGWSGGLWMLVGSLLIIGSLWAAFLTNDLVTGAS